MWVTRLVYPKFMDLVVKLYPQRVKWASQKNKTLNPKF